MADSSGQTRSQPKSGVSVSQPQSPIQGKRKRVAEVVSVSGEGEKEAVAGGQSAGACEEDAGLPSRKSRSRRTSETTRAARQSKDWESFQVMCKTLKSRHDIDDAKELNDMWEQLDNCLRTTGARNDIHWYLRCNDGRQHNTICGFMAEWQASKGSAVADSSPERESSSAAQQASLSAPSKYTTSIDHHDREPAASDHVHSKERPPDGSSSHQPSGQNGNAAVGTGKLDSNTASAGGLSRSAGPDNSKEVQQSSSAAGSGESVIRLPAPSHSTSLVQQPARGSVEPTRAATSVNHQFPEPQARPRPTGKTKSAADVHKQSPDKQLAVQQQHQRKGKGLLCLVPKTNAVGAADLTSAEVSNQARLEAPTSSGETTIQPAMDQTPMSAPGSPSPGKLAFPFKLHCGRGQPAGLDDTCDGSSGSSEQSPNVVAQTPASVQKAQPVAEVATNPTRVDPTNVSPAVAHPSSVEPPSRGDPASADPSHAGTSRVEPISADTNRADLTTVNPSSVNPTGVDHSSVKGNEMTAVPQASQHVAAAVAPAGIDMQAEERLINSLAQLLESSSAAPGPVGKSTGVEQVMPQGAGPSCNDTSTAPVDDGAALVHPSPIWAIFCQAAAVYVPPDELQYFMDELCVADMCGMDMQTHGTCWKSAYSLAMQYEADRLKLFSHEDKVLKARMRLEFQDSKLKTRKLVHDKLADVQDEPIRDYVSLSLDTWADAKKQTQQQLADHTHAISYIYEQLDKYHCILIDMLQNMALPELM